MSDNWVVQNLENARETWNSKLSEIWQLLTTSPQEFKGGSIWSVMVNINGAVQAIGLICTPKVRHFWRCIFFMGKTGRKNKNYSPEFKIGVIMDMREHRLGYCETVRKYGLGAVETGGARAMLQRWERIFLEEGAEGLMKERRGESNTSCKRGRPPKLDKKVEEDLIAENQRLRMEIEYLKKLSALVLADEQKNGKRRS